jgi:RNA polymerase sigma-70 factor, ECF subfamily
MAEPVPPTRDIDSTPRATPGAENELAKNHALVRSAQNGDVSAIRELYLGHQEHIYRFIWSRVYDPDLADDLTGEVFLRMIKSLPRYQDRALPFRAWLYRIAHNLVIDYHRKQDRRVTMPLEKMDNRLVEIKSLEERTEQTVTFEQVQQALAQLAPHEREVIEMRFLAGLSLKETAHALDRTVAAVKALQYRGLVSLRARITF